MRTKLIMAMLILAVFQIYADDAPFAGKKEIRILVFGNSFSHGIMEDLPGIAEAAGKKVEVRCLRIGGLNQYWAAIEAAEKNPDDPAAFIMLESDYKTNKTKVRVKDELLSKPWDLIVLQQHSSMSADLKKYLPYAKQIHDYAQKLVPGAKFVFYQTHAYRNDCLLYKATANPIYRDPYTEDEMNADIRNCVLATCKELGIPRVPVGEAFQKARRDPRWGYEFPDPNFDYLNAKPPARPDESHSLHIGFQWGELKKRNLPFQIDNHPNNLGRYICGAVFYEYLFGESVVGNKHRPEGPGGGKQMSQSDLDRNANKPVTEEVVAALQQIVHETLEEIKD